MSAIKFYKHEQIPMEMHKVKIVQQLHLLKADERLNKMKEAHFNTFQLHNGDIFLDMLTDSGVNAMSDRQQAAMLVADDAYAGSETFYRMEDKLKEIFGDFYLLPAHQGRACENILATRFVKENNCVIMNYHFIILRKIKGNIASMQIVIRKIFFNHMLFITATDYKIIKTVMRIKLHDMPKYGFSCWYDWRWSK